MFALDSIPAVFGVTSPALHRLGGQRIRLLGLRALFFLVTGLLDRMVYLLAGLALILAFIGWKLILHWATGSIPGCRKSAPPYRLRSSERCWPSPRWPA